MLLRRKYIVLSFIAFIGCATPLALPTEQDLVHAPVNGKNMDLAALRNGHSLYQNKCGSCHYLYRPAGISEEHWKEEMPEMSRRAKISPAQEELILHYLLTMREAQLAQRK